MYESIKEKIEEILKITNKCPENLQEKCFELLITPLIKGGRSTDVEEKSNDETDVEEEPKKDFIISIDVKAFLHQYNVAEEKLSSLFLMQENKVRPTYSLSTTKKARGQIQIAVLSALENALKGGKFQFSIPATKNRCIELKTYDVANFQKIFKKNKELFKSLDDAENVELSPSGKEKLAEVIIQMTK